MGPTPTQKPLFQHQRELLQEQGEILTKQGPSPLLISGHSPETLQLPSRQPTMAWVLARHGSDDISGVHVITHHIVMTVHTTTEHLSTPTSPSHSAHTAQLGRLEKRFHQQRDSSAQTLLHLTQSITPAVTSLPPSFRQWKAPDSTLGHSTLPGSNLAEYQTGASPEKRIELIVTAGVGPVWSGQHLEYNAQRQKPLRALLPTSLPPSKEIFFSTSSSTLSSTVTN